MDGEEVSYADSRCKRLILASGRLFYWRTEVTRVCQPEGRPVKNFVDTLPSEL